MNLPFFFLKSLEKISSRVKEHQDHTKQSVFNHGLIKLVISTVLRKKEKTWDYFLFWSGFQIEKEDQAQKIQLNKVHNVVKKLKKRATINIKEDNVQEKSMTQGDENVEVEQQTNIEENEMAKEEVKDVDPVEDTLHVELNQGVKENVKEQEQVPVTLQSEDEEKSLSDEARVHTKQNVQK